MRRAEWAGVAALAAGAAVVVARAREGAPWALLCFAGLAMAAYVLRRGPRPAGLGRLRAGPGEGTWITPGRRDSRTVPWLGRRLGRAGVADTGRWWRHTAGMVLLAAALGGIAAGPPGAVLGAAGAAGVRWAVLAVAATRRLGRLHDSLPDALDMLAASLRAGHSLESSLGAVAEEVPAPLGDELARVVGEVGLGLGVDEALAAAAGRTGSDDVVWFAEAVAIQRGLGGELAGLVGNVAATVRERQRLRRQVRALSAEGRLSAGILFVLPLALLVVLKVRNPSYLAVLTGSTTGVAMLAAGGVLLVTGGLWLQRIVKVEL